MLLVNSVTLRNWMLDPQLEDFARFDERQARFDDNLLAITALTTTTTSLQSYIALVQHAYAIYHLAATGLFFIQLQQFNASSYASFVLTKQQQVDDFFIPQYFIHNYPHLLTTLTNHTLLINSSTNTNSSSSTTIIDLPCTLTYTLASRRCWLHFNVKSRENVSRVLLRMYDNEHDLLQPRQERAYDNLQQVIITIGMGTHTR